MTASNGLRYADECVRHKILDALGDLSLVGRPILGKFVSFSGGHGLTNMLLRESFNRGDVFVKRNFQMEIEINSQGSTFLMMIQRIYCNH